MTNKDLADLIFPNAKDISYYEELYPSRNLKEGAVVSRYAPSPTGFMHLGNLLQVFLGDVMIKQTDGVYFLRIEDTDTERIVDGAVDVIKDSLAYFGYEFTEGYDIGGNYGPYKQSERKEIYEAYAKYLISEGKAYPCFCTKEEIEETRKIQEASKERIGYYGSFATCRNIPLEEAAERIKNGAAYIIRLKSFGDFSKKHYLTDEIKGELEYFENDMDIPIIKSDGLPTYHFAHAVDDHLMHTTHVIRGDEWVSSLPLHIDLFNSLGFEHPKYCHIAPLTKVDEETGNIRKLSKRKDPEFNLSFFKENGIPPEAVKLYLSIISNTNFEEWYLANPDKSFREFEFSFSKCPVGGTLFDMVKLDNVAKVYMSRMKAEDIYEGLLKYTEEYDKEFNELIKEHKDYLISILNIERGGERPRKDLGSYKDVRKEFWYMFDELFNKIDNPYKDADLSKYDLDDIKEYITNVYDSNLTQEDWFNNLKEWVSGKGYATNRKEYKENPDAFKGDVTLFCEGLRVMLTTNTSSPNLYDLLKIYGKEKLIERIKRI